MKAKKIFVELDGQMERVLHHEKAARKLGISPNTLASYISRNQFPFEVKPIHIKNLTFYKRKDIDILKARKIIKRNEQSRNI